ncbi:MAG: deoxyribonuclease IV [Pigeon pea little leaf phytoplasma]|uniref:Probable endonuclease 4 n=1 Tax=Candidatus Phytoplasma fabacearum TaxID=2982628 RepID=A0ABU8ZSI7_9MOLU|nr:deoxyribonuclease IV ['Bituminaria bituminosa' little leaf phytoplasma]MDV3148936.1 deoxyribonuclease IV [Pigeon pea little leaf phytoplasma]MDO7983463.1 deoxyribonuclease IV ['Bituminaria bituminosa' little leaf phytoplasma]MDO8023780.1 deoxyribonuclease IV ['Bituminaria bituminosa' little leaf phytoplasma]MDO8030401.1 deoxyribonuclease IV ['Bituminaria bituminosa' little leaf phytoplasma]MDV3153993.1 deoxyribonuclease IV [Pigeon pea little leaf phytoplasma]
MLIIGSHVSFKKPKMYLGALEQALSFNSNTFMLYSGPPQNTKRNIITKDDIDQTLSEMKKHNINVNYLVGHAPYIVNLANPILNKREFAIEFLIKELNRFAQMKIPQMVIHPGNNLNKNKLEAIKWIAQGINKIFKNTSNLKTKIALETMAGKGNEIGSNFQELKNIIDLIEDKKRISICFDTCHVFDAGYDIKNQFENIIKQFDKIINLKYLSVLHINDSKNYLGSKKDRHENIGYGQIGFEVLIKIIYYPLFDNIPKILETPFVNEKPIYKEEIIMIKKRLFNKNLKLK